LEFQLYQIGTLLIQKTRPVSQKASRHSPFYLNITSFSISKEKIRKGLIAMPK